jgi:hypothetical protein
MEMKWSQLEVDVFAAHVLLEGFGGFIVELLQELAVGKDHGS